MYSKLLSESGISLDRLASFCAVADAGSIAKVSQGDPSRQALISRQIRELETFFGTELVKRQGRGLVLTQPGKELAAVGREGFKGLSDFKARCRETQWTLKLAASNSVLQWVVLPRLERLDLGSRGIRLELHHESTRDMMTKTREGVYDLAIARTSAIEGKLQSASIGKSGFTLCVPKHLAKTKPKSLRHALAACPLALMVGGTVREQVDRIALEKNLELNVALSCTSYIQALEALKSGGYAAVLPDLALHTVEKSNTHRFRLLPGEEYCLTWSARSVTTRARLEAVIHDMRRGLRIA